MTEATQKLSDAGVSLWLDDLSRERLETGNLQELVETYRENRAYRAGATTPQAAIVAWRKRIRYALVLMADPLPGSRSDSVGAIPATRAATVPRLAVANPRRCLAARYPVLARCTRSAPAAPRPNCRSPCRVAGI